MDERKVNLDAYDVSNYAVGWWLLYIVDRLHEG